MYISIYNKGVFNEKLHLKDININSPLSSFDGQCNYSISHQGYVINLTISDIKKESLLSSLMSNPVNAEPDILIYDSSKNEATAFYGAVKSWNPFRDQISILLPDPIQSQLFVFDTKNQIWTLNGNSV